MNTKVLDDGTILTPEEQRIKNKYFKMCAGFGVPPVSDWQNVLTDDDVIEAEKMAEERLNALKVYRKKCKDLGIKQKDEKALKLMKVSKIWDWILKVTDEAVTARFKPAFSEMKGEPVIKRKRKATIKTLYDESIYVTPEQAKGILNATTDEQIIREYRKLGGKENLLVLKEIEATAYLGDIEDEDIDDCDNDEEE